MILEAESILFRRAEATVGGGRRRRFWAVQIEDNLWPGERVSVGLKVRGGIVLPRAHGLGYNRMSVTEDVLCTGTVRRLSERKGSLGVWPRRREALNSFHYVLVMPKASRTALRRANYREDRAT